MHACMHALTHARTVIVPCYRIITVLSYYLIIAVLSYYHIIAVLLIRVITILILCPACTCACVGRVQGWVGGLANQLCRHLESASLGFL